MSQRSMTRRSTVVMLLLALVVSACAHRSTRADIVAAYGDGEGPGTSDSMAATTVPEVKAPTDGPETTVGGTAASGPETTAPPAAAAPGAENPDPGDAPVEEAGPADPPGAANKSPVNIGHIGTYSGVLGAIFAGGQHMAQAWAQDVNSRGGLNGHPVNVITADDGGDPARAQALVKNMVENQDVIAFVGNLTILTTQAYADYVEQNRVPVIGGDLYNLIWWNSPMLFPNGTHLTATILGLAELPVRNGVTKIGMVRCVETFACQHAGDVLGDGGAEQVGADLVYDAEISLAQPNFTRECLAAQDAGAEAMIIGADVNATSRFARDCSTQGYEPLLVTASLAATEAAASDPNLDGLLVVSTVFPWTATDTPAAARHLDVLNQYAPGVAPSGSTAQVWTAGKLLEAAAVDLPDAPTADDVIEGLYGLGDTTVEGLAPSLRFNRDKPASESPCYSVIEVAGGSFSAPEGSSFTCL